MKRIMMLMLVAILLFPSIACCETGWRVFDNASVLNEESFGSLELEIWNYQKATGLDFVFLTTDDYLGDDARALGIYFWEHGAYGFGSDASGILFYLDMNQRYVQIITTGQAVSLVPDTEIETILDQITPLLTAGEYYEAVSTAMTYTKELVEKNKATE